jgi:hypothetical protein
MPKPPSKKIVGFKVKKTPGKVWNEGSKTTTEMRATAGPTTKKYTPEKADTKHSAYYGTGDPNSKSKIRQTQEAGVAKAHANKQDVVNLPVGKGGAVVPIRAGRTTHEHTPPKFTTEHKVNPRLQLPGKTTVEPIYKSDSGIKQNFGKQKKRRLPHVDYLEKIKRNKRTESGHGR